MSWPEVCLGDICEFSYGKSLPASNRTPGEYSVFGSNGQVGSHNTSITTGPTIIIGRKGSFGEVNYSESSCWPIDTTYYIDSSSLIGNISLRWLYYRVSALGLTALNRAAAVPGLNRDDAYRLRLLLPPQDEQRRIAAALDQVDALREQRRKAITLLDELVHSIYSELTTIQTHSPEKRPLSSMIKVRSGQFLPAKEMAVDGRYPVYGGNGVSGYHDQYLFEESKIVIGRVGYYCGSVHVAPPRSWITDNALYVEKVDESVDDTYLGWALRFADLNRYASKSAQPLISGSRIYPIEIVVPDDQAQQKFRKLTEEIATQRASHVTHLAGLDALFASVQWRAFRGELWETASE